MRSFFKHFLPTLAVLAVSCAQVFGMQYGYVCTHQEEIVNTAAAHCHRTDEGVVPCSGSAEKDHHENDSDHEHHKPADIELNAAMATLSMPAIPAYIAVMVAELPTLDSLRLLVLSELSINNVPPDIAGDHPPASVQVARCMVMLI